MGTKTYFDSDVALSGTVFRPIGPARAAVAVYSTIMNPTPAVEAKARLLADAGFIVMMCDFYGATPTDFAEAVALSTELRSASSRYRRRLHAGLNALREEAGSLPLLAIGFCMGGQAVLELARDSADLAAVNELSRATRHSRAGGPGYGQVPHTGVSRRCR